MPRFFNLHTLWDSVVKYYNNERYHESLKNLTPADVYFGRAERRLKHRKIVKLKTLNDRKKLNQKIKVTL
jgi:putative transposase